MQLDLQTVLAMHAMRQMQHSPVPSDDDLLDDQECCPTCGGMMFEDETSPFNFYCPDCDLVLP